MTERFKQIYNGIIVFILISLVSSASAVMLPDWENEQVIQRNRYRKVSVSVSMGQNSPKLDQGSG